MIRKRTKTRAGFVLAAAALVGTFGIASASSPDTTPPGSAAAPVDPCASEAAPATTEAAVATTEAPVDTAAAATEAAVATTAAPATEAPAPTEARETVPPAVTELDASTSIDINEQPRDALQQGGELRLKVGSFADNWNPNHTLGNEVDYVLIREPMSYHIWQADAEANFTLITDYVLDVTTSDPVPGQPWTVTYTLNPEAKWNSGDPITVADYQANWNALNGKNTDFTVVATEGYDSITSVEPGVDEFQVVITFDDVYPDYQALFDPLAPAASYADPDIYNNGWGEINTDWFTGPFILESIDTVQGILTEVPNPNWWGEAPLLDRLIYRIVVDEAVPTAYANGELDSFDIGPDPNGFAIANTTPGGTVRAAAAPNYRGLTFNTTAGLTADQTIRQAIVRSLDRADIGASDLAGIPWPARPLNNHIFVENQAGYVDNAGDFAYDPERAAADLEAAGWVVGDDGIREKDGQRLTVRYSYFIGTPVSENEAQLVQAQLAEVGIEVELVGVAPDQFSNILDSRDFELVAFSWFGTPFPFRGTLQVHGNCSDSNYSNSYIPGFNEIWDEIGRTVDVAKRTKLANESDLLLWDYVTTLPLYQRPELIATSTELANYGAFGFMTPRPWTDVGWMA